jgi:transposase
LQQRHKNICLKFDLNPNIKCNPRNTKKAAIAPDMPIYMERYVNERAFAWEDTYRRLVTRYEVYARNHLAFTYMAAGLTLLRLII